MAKRHSGGQDILDLPDKLEIRRAAKATDMTAFLVKPSDE